jgi:Recombination endonuclease VII
MVDGSIAPDGKFCTRCHEWKTNDQFFQRKLKHRSVPTSACKGCFKAYSDARRAAQISYCRKQERDSKRRRRPLYDETIRLRAREWQLRNKYGMTVEDFTALLASQGGGCAICQRSVIYSGKQAGLRELACIDHDHSTGRVRGILCQACNTAIGLLADDPVRIRCAAEYLETRLGRDEWTPVRRQPQFATAPL